MQAYENENILTYQKLDPTEVISFGDIIMLDTSSGYITRAVLNKPKEMNTNHRLVVGVCVGSYETIIDENIIDGGTSDNKIKRLLLEGGFSRDLQTIIIDGGNSSNVYTQIIQVAYSDVQIVNIHGFVNIGDKVCISKHPGKARSKDFIEVETYDARTIGTVTKYTENDKQVKVLLAIE